MYVRRNTSESTIFHPSYDCSISYSKTLSTKFEYSLGTKTDQRLRAPRRAPLEYLIPTKQIPGASREGGSPAPAHGMRPRCDLSPRCLPTFSWLSPGFFEPSSAAALAVRVTVVLLPRRVAHVTTPSSCPMAAHAVYAAYAAYTGAAPMPGAACHRLVSQHCRVLDTDRIQGILETQK
jgi:hypothetical protein